MYKKKIIDAKKGANGSITKVKFEGNENFTNIGKAISMAEQEKVDAVVVETESGGKHLRSRPDSIIRNNLDSMAGC